MEFGIALHKLQQKEAKSIYREAWNNDIKIKLQNPDKNSKMTSIYLYVTSKKGKVPWVPNMPELVVYKDWLIEKKQTRYEKQLFKGDI